MDFYLYGHLCNIWIFICSAVYMSGLEFINWCLTLAGPKIRRSKPCLEMFASLVTLDGFHLLLSSQLTTDLIPEWCGDSMFHPLSHIYAKTSFCCVETVANNALNRQCVVVFDRLRVNATPTVTTAFSLTKVHAKWWT